MRRVSVAAHSLYMSANLKMPPHTHQEIARLSGTKGDDFDGHTTIGAGDFKGMTSDFAFPCGSCHGCKVCSCDQIATIHGQFPHNFRKFGVLTIIFVLLGIIRGVNLLSIRNT